MLKISAKKLVEIVNSDSKVDDVEVDVIETDSRKIKKGDVFLAIRGENFDAHNFVKNVVEAGASFVVVDRIIEDVPENKQIVVDDTLKAYGKIGAYVRSKFKGVVIGLTGSAGKTTTKEEIKFALSEYGQVYATMGNFNNHIGVPKTLIDMDMNADYAIIEMGMSSKGEILALTNLVKPDIAIVTNVYPMHIEFFNNFEEIAYAKAEIFAGLKSDGVAIINQDTNFVDVLRKQALLQGAKLIEFGKNEHPDVRLELSEIGEHHLYNAWCVLSLIKELGLDVARTAKSLKNFGALDGRGKKHKLEFNKGQYTLIDDSYSGQPEAMKLAIQSLNMLEHKGRKIVVLGKMAELGDTSKQRHMEIGDLLSNTDIDVVIGVCPEMKDMLERLPKDKEQYYFENKDGLDEFLLNKLLQNNDIVLIKGARYSSKLYQISEALINKGAKE